jgi:hypothetical protein
MVAFHHWHSHISDNVQALLGIGTVTHYITQASVVRAPLLFRVTQNGLQCLKIRVYVSYDRKFHLCRAYSTGFFFI